ncbi:MAG: non-heme iron oxygenase ferredoxin subunit [Micrococcales bacterium]|nr:non-heme iron oxygenase ferredoxin subunit [Micrococcales bacterium]MCL2668806.1 non-heme iron oxygenase ferredoxin subunit [Micrococcales bacterium]
MTAQFACRTSDVAVATMLRCELDGPDGRVAVVVVHDGDGGWYALADKCSHGDIPLSKGDVEGCTIECLGHGSPFDLRTGKPLKPPATDPVAVYPVTIDDDCVYVDTDVPGPSPEPTHA